MQNKKVDKEKLKKSKYYKYLLKTSSFLNKSGVLKSSKWIYYGVIIGVLSAFGAAVFMHILKYVSATVMGGMIGYTGNELEPIIFMPGMKKWLILVVPAVGALLAGIISMKFAPETRGHGTDNVIRCFHKENGIMSLKTSLIKIIATTLVIGTGGSAGREGPIAQISAGFASFLGTKLKVSVKERRIMLMAGAGAGIAALFGAPLGGAIFGTEVLYKNQDLESEAIIPSIISSIVSFSVFRAIMGQEHLFNITGVAFSSAYELIPYALLGIICAIAGIFYVKVFDRISAEFKKMKLNEMLKPAVGGFLVGAIGLFLPQILAGGYGFMQMAFDGTLPIKLMLILVFGKILATSFTIGSGGSGGVFGPSLFIGAMLGGSIGGVFEHIFPDTWVTSQAAFVVVGMGGFFSGVARVPLSSLFMVSEMTGGYQLLVPMMLVSSTSFLLNRKPSTLYHEQVESIIDSPAHKGDFEIDILEDIKVKDVKVDGKDLIIISRRMTLDKVIPIITHTKQDTFPVVDTKKGGKLVGIFTFEDIRAEITEKDLLEVTMADDVATKDFLYVTPEEDLHSAMNKFLLEDHDALPVLDPKTRKFIGLLTRTAFIKIYHSRFAQMKKRD